MIGFLRGKLREKRKNEMEWQGWMRGGKRKEERWNNKKENMVFWEGKCSTFGKTNKPRKGKCEKPHFWKLFSNQLHTLYKCK